MEVKTAIDTRRSYRSLTNVENPEKLIEILSSAAALAPSCFNNQPWRYVFVYEKEVLEKIKGVLSKGNEWAYESNLIGAVFSKKENDCIIKNREYNWFDTGMSTGFIILRAWECGVVAHPIAGFDESKAKEILNIPADYQLLTLLIMGNHSSSLNHVLNEKQRESEFKRPERLALNQYIYHNQFCLE